MSDQDYIDAVYGEEEEEQEPTIQYVLQIIDTKKKDYIKTIKYSDIDEYDFNNHFLECIKNPTFVHPYFDFDSIETKEEYEEVIDWLDSLKETFGNYSIGGYTNNNELFGDLYKYIENANHVLSLHAVYYEKKIKADIFIELMKQQNGVFILYIN